MPAGGRSADGAPPYGVQPPDRPGRPGRPAEYQEYEPSSPRGDPPRAIGPQRSCTWESEPSILLIAIGAILLWAVTATVAGVSINTIGVILIVVGAIGLLFSLIATSRAGADRPVDPRV